MRMRAAVGSMARWGSAAVLVSALAAPSAATAADPAVDPAITALRAAMVTELNNHSTIQGPEDAKSYRILFDAFLKMTKPPMPIGALFNLRTVHPKMQEWPAVAAWAEANPGMADAIIACKPSYVKRKGKMGVVRRASGTSILGLPYGEEQVSSEYRSAGLMVAIGVDGNLRNNQFPYMVAAETIAAYATAEIYRRMDTGKTDEAIDLAVANLWVLRQLSDRRFVAEKRESIDMLTAALANLRDVFHLYLDKISVEHFSDLARNDIPQLLLLRRRLELPEADRIVAESLLRSVFDAQDQPIEERFASVFGAIQASEAPLELFGAVQRWRAIGRVHASLRSSQERLKLVYDDWWRRWQLLEYEETLDLPTEFERLNAVRFAAVAYALDPIEDLFPLRNRLIASINGTAMASGLCAYRRFYGNFPNDREKIYGQYLRQTQSDIDPYDNEYGLFLYKLLDVRTALDTPEGRLWLEPGQCMLWARGDDHQDHGGTQHTDGTTHGTDFVLWPPIQALERQAGLVP
jgi:hypothetical protein